MSTVELLEARARSLGLVVSDAPIWGDAWSTVLLRRIDDELFRRHLELRAAERRAREASL